jgi:uncharacterized protein YdeI (YjbR/CyaY-like superfamily)
MKELEYIYFKNREELRNWLQKFHDTCSGIWVIFYKKHLKIECIKYQEVLEEALCFGWIDSIIKKIDEDKYVRKITPRVDTKNWSELNKKIVNELIKKGRMTQAGLRKIDCYLETGTVDWKSKKPERKRIHNSDIPDFIFEELARNEPALINFNNLAPTYKRHFIVWITYAKKAETVRARLKESIRLLKDNKKLGLK